MNLKFPSVSKFCWFQLFCWIGLGGGIILLKIHYRTLKITHQNLTQTYQEQKRYHHLWEQFIKKYNYTQKFDTIQKELQDALETSGISVGEITIGPAEVVIKERSHCLYKTSVLFSVSMKDDRLFWQFLNQCSRSFPGKIRICEINLDKLDCLEEPDILEYANLTIKGEYRFEWYHLGP